MCGIFCILSPCSYQNNNEKFENIHKKCECNLKRRGPDYEKSCFINISKWDFMVSSSVLWLQGLNLTKQPIETEKYMFLFNGDIFESCLEDNLLSNDSRYENGDTKPLLKCIENSEDIISIFTKLEGPYAFILLDKLDSKLYFARDTFGRRSLLIGKNQTNFLLTSVACREINFEMIELPALGIYCIDLKTEEISCMKLFPWRTKNQHFSEKLTELKQFLSIDINYEIINDNNEDKIKQNPCNNEILFLKQLEHLKTNEAFSLILTNEKWLNNILNLKHLLEKAIKKRIRNQPKFCKDCIKLQSTSCRHSTVGILFSGGLDCAVLTLLADQFIDSYRSIDLMNVAFEKGNGFNTPDRITAKQTLEELRKIQPNREWNLLEIDVTQEELVLERSERIGDLIYPLQSILDESLGCALWFAARGRTETYISPCRVLLVGMGADELLGGYTRHRAAYKRNEWTGLTTELDNDWKNISHRNLARDDRVVSDHGRQLRTPYLDERVVQFLRELDAWNKCYPSETLKHVLGDKLLLRALAYHLGLRQAATHRKRALQFGSRIANSKENAHDISPRL